MTTAETLPVVVIGAGPVGLAAAAQLLERGLEPLVLEAGDDAAAAADLQLDLPETGVCSTPTSTPEIDAADGGSCCATAAPKPVSTGTGPVGASVGAGLGFTTGFAHGRSGSGNC